MMEKCRTCTHAGMVYTCAECGTGFKNYEPIKNGCDFCKNKDDDTLWEAGGAHEFRLYQNGLYYYDENTGWEGIEIEFCPKCGRKL